MASRTTTKKGGFRGRAVSTPRLSTRKANAAGFAKRHARSAQTAADADVYDYQPGKNRRANVALTLDEDESKGAGYDDEDEEEEEGRARGRPRLVGERNEDERIGSDEDEEIDSDAAFEESDEERFAEFGFKKKGPTNSKKAAPKQKRQSVRFTEVDLDEDKDAVQNGAESDDVSKASEDGDEEEEEGDDDEFLDVLDVLDGRGVPDLGDDAPRSEVEKKPSSKIGESRDDGLENEDAMDEDEDEDTEEDEDDEDVAISASDEDEVDPSALDNLGNFVSGLETGAKRKAVDVEEGDEASAGAPQANKKKRLIKDRTESGMESEFGARAAGPSKLSLEDLLTPLISQPSALSSLKKTLKPLASSSNPKSQPLPAPLPTRTQEKIDREAAYEQTKQEVDKWSETMKKIQEAEHLSFPLQTPKTVKVSNLELTAKFKPSTELESSIDRLLKSAKLREEDINKTEDLMMKDLSVEEVAARRAELRKMRELAFRADSKAKRVAKIKSKAFRRIQKKERAKLMAKLDAGADEGAAGDAEEERMNAELERARERATLKHKNTGKWAKAMKARGNLDADQRHDINEMLERGERLRRRIQGEASGSEDGDDGDSSDDDVEGEDGVMRIKANAFEELDRLQMDEGGDGEDGEADSEKKAKSVFEMKFMKDAAARKNQEVDRMIEDFRKEMGDMPAVSDDEMTEKNAETSTPERVNGRMVFRPGPEVQTKSKELSPPPPTAISETSTLRSHDSHALTPVLAIHDSPTSPSPLPASRLTPVPLEEPNPWLALPESASSSSKLARRKNEVVVGRESTRAQKSEVALQKQLKKTVKEREREREDAMVEISAGDVWLPKHAEAEKVADVTALANPAAFDDRIKKKLKKAKGKEVLHEDEDVNSEIEEQEAALSKGKKTKAFEQRELVARAFAGDNVVRQFEEAKRKEIEADAPREVDTTLPGWGSWGGTGTKKAAPKAHLIKKVAGIDPKSRADYGKAHVIISERRDKKAARYAVRDLPYPYTSKAQFEASMSTPLGTEWNTRLGFQRGTLPRVVKKMGTVIDALEKL